MAFKPRDLHGELGALAGPKAEGEVSDSWLMAHGSPKDYRTFHLYVRVQTPINFYEMARQLDPEQIDAMIDCLVKVKEEKGRVRK